MSGVRKRSNDWIVGAVVLGVMLALVATTMFLQRTDIGRRRAEVVAHFRDVGNMTVGNAVVIRGVNAGRVEQVSLAPNDWVTVRMTLNEGVEIPADPVVLAQSASLFGEWQAMITQRSSAPAIREVILQLDDTEGAPAGTLPGAVLPDIAQLTSVAGGIAGNVASVAERVRVAFDDSAARELRATIRNFNAMSAQLSRTVRDQSRNLDSVAKDVLIGVDRVADGASALQRSMARLDSATSAGEVQRIIGETQVAALNLRTVAERLAALSQTLQRSEANLHSIAINSDSVLRRIERGDGSLGLLINDPSLYHSADSLMVDLRGLIADFRANPKKYVNLRVF